MRSNRTGTLLYKPAFGITAEVLSPLLRFLQERNENHLCYHQRTLQQQPEIQSPHRNQIGGQPLYPKHRNCKKKRQRDDRSHNNRGTPVEQKQEHDKWHKQNPLQHISDYSVHSSIDKPSSVHKGHYLYILRQNSVVKFCDFILKTRDDFARVLTTEHYHDALYHIVIVIEPNLPLARFCRYGYRGNFFNPNRRTAFGGNQ